MAFNDPPSSEKAAWQATESLGIYQSLLSRASSRQLSSQLRFIQPLGTRSLGVLQPKAFLSSPSDPADSEDDVSTFEDFPFFQEARSDSPSPPANAPAIQRETAPLPPAIVDQASQESVLSDRGADTEPLLSSRLAPPEEQPASALLNSDEASTTLPTFTPPAEGADLLREQAEASPPEGGYAPTPSSDLEDDGVGENSPLAPAQSAEPAAPPIAASAVPPVQHAEVSNTDAESSLSSEFVPSQNESIREQLPPATLSAPVEPVQDQPSSFDFNQPVAETPRAEAVSTPADDSGNVPTNGPVSPLLTSPDTPFDGGTAAESPNAVTSSGNLEQSPTEGVASVPVQRSHQPPTSVEAPASSESPDTAATIPSASTPAVSDSAVPDLREQEATASHDLEPAPPQDQSLEDASDLATPPDSPPAAEPPPSLTTETLQRQEDASSVVREEPFEERQAGEISTEAVGAAITEEASSAQPVLSPEIPDPSRAVESTVSAPDGPSLPEISALTQPSESASSEQSSPAIAASPAIQRESLVAESPSTPDASESPIPATLEEASGSPSTPSANEAAADAISSPQHSAPPEATVQNGSLLPPQPPLEPQDVPTATQAHSEAASQSEEIISATAEAPIAGIQRQTTLEPPSLAETETAPESVPEDAVPKEISPGPSATPAVESTSDLPKTTEQRQVELVPSSQPEDFLNLPSASEFSPAEEFSSETPSPISLPTNEGTGSTVPPSVQRSQLEAPIAPIPEATVAPSANLPLAATPTPSTVPSEVEASIPPASNEPPSLPQGQSQFSPEAESGASLEVDPVALAGEQLTADTPQPFTAPAAPGPVIPTPSKSSEVDADGEQPFLSGNQTIQRSLSLPTVVQDLSVYTPLRSSQPLNPAADVDETLSLDPPQQPPSANTALQSPLTEPAPSVSDAALINENPAQSSALPPESSVTVQRQATEVPTAADSSDTPPAWGSIEDLLTQLPPDKAKAAPPAERPVVNAIAPLDVEPFSNLHAADTTPLPVQAAPLDISPLSPTVIQRLATDSPETNTQPPPPTSNSSQESAGSTEALERLAEAMYQRVRQRLAVERERLGRSGSGRFI